MNQLKHILKHLGTLFLFCAPLFLNAQPYSLFPDNREWTYVQVVDQELRWVRTDSFTLEGPDTVFYFNQRIGVRPGMSPDCALVVDDTIEMGARMIKKADNTHLLFNRYGDTITLRPQEEIGNVWRFFTYPNDDYFDAEAWQFFEHGIFPGLSDSLKRMRLFAHLSSGGTMPSNVFHTRIIDFNKNWGISRIYDFHNFPEDSTRINLIGISKPDSGTTNPDAVDVFRFQTGNEFHLEYFDIAGDATEHQSVLVKEKRFLLWTEAGEADTLEFEWFRIRIIDSVNTATSFSWHGYVIDTLYEKLALADYAFLDVFPNEYHQWNAHGFSRLITEPSMYFNRQQKQVHDYFDFDAVEKCLMEPVDTVHPEYTFVRGLGLVHQYEKTADPADFNYNSVNLVYYQKGVEQWGEPYNFDSIGVGLPTNLIGLHQLRLFPNPAGDFIYLNWNGPTPLQIDIIDVTGRRWQQTEWEGNAGQTQKLHTGQLPRGLYKVIVTLPGGRVAVSFIR